MTDYFLSLIPDYGLWIVFGCVAIACLGIPLPSSVVVLTSGGLATSGDLVLWQVLVTAFGAYTLGDQTAFALSRRVGPNLLGKLRSVARFKPLVDRGEDLLQRKGIGAVFLSHTILSPTGPYVSYICGASKISWLSFTLPALVGTCLWTGAYAYMGYGLAGQMTALSDIVGKFLWVGLSFVAFAGSSTWLYRRWKIFAAQIEISAEVEKH